jgi:hypothetical protein
MTLQRTFFILLLTVLLTGCSVSDRPPYSTEMQVTINENGFSTLRWHVPASEEITVQLTNQTENNQTWSILSPSGPGKPGHAWLTEQVLPGETLSLTFTAPAAPGEYDVVSMSDGEPESQMTAEMVVIQP